VALRGDAPPPRVITSISPLLLFFFPLLSGYLSGYLSVYSVRFRYVICLLFLAQNLSAWAFRQGVGFRCSENRVFARV